MKTLNIPNSNRLNDLRAIFVAAGFDLWLVGGCVRDSLLGKTPKDIDLATSATPDEQIDIYKNNDVRFIPTGITHGTISVVMGGETYEITSLRTEANHDGRHATVAYTRDINIDLSRRDLSINAIAMDFDGNLIDPFSGAKDLADRRVRFVGDAKERMREDYLRILRFFRFHARIAGDTEFDSEAVTAIQQARAGLSQISVERIWSEMSRIVTGNVAVETLKRIATLTIFEIIGMPFGVFPDLSKAINVGVTDASALMGFFLNKEQVTDLSVMWKWARAETERALFVSKNKREADIKRFKEMLVDGVPKAWVDDLLRFSLMPDALKNWEVPVNPVRGADLLTMGMKPGPKMGDALKALTRLWKDSDYSLSHSDLVEKSREFLDA